MRISANDFGALRRSFVAEIHQSLPRSGHRQRVAVGFDEAVDKVHIALGFLRPKDRILIECAKRTGFVVFNQFLDIGLLLIVFGIFGSLFKVGYNFFDSVGIQTAHFVNLFHHFAVFLHHFRVQSVGHRCRVVGIFNRIVVGFHLLLCHALVEIVGRSSDQILPCRQVHPFRHKIFIKNHLIHDFDKRRFGLSLHQRQF